MKILFPNGRATKQEIEDLLRFSMEGRKRVKDQLLRIDSTYAEVHFAYDDNEGISQAVTTLEEEEYPTYYYQKLENQDSEATSKTPKKSESSSIDNPIEQTTSCVLKEQHLVYKENQRGVSFDTLFGPYLKNARKIVITDPYIRLFYQARNLMEFIETAIKQKAKEDELDIHLITTFDEFKGEFQIEYLESIKKSASIAGIEFTWEFDGTNTIHARHIVTDTNWKISLDRGLDIFQHYEMNDVFSISNRLQEFRNCKAFEVTFLHSK